ncbi:MAG TPA: phospholipase D-like domain-containing protein [Vicinamibacterales bacterium]
MIGAADRKLRDDATDASRGAIVRPGRNCWRVERADRFLCVQDAADYFRLVRRALLAARDTVFILGWDILASVDLDPCGARDASPTRLDELLAFIARRRPRLRCYVLIWDYGAIYALERDPFSRWRLGWRMPRHVHFAFDDRHAVGGCHHQKIVVVDDQLAFCGGVDLTGHRWDTSAHRVVEPARKTPVGDAYEPYHDVQAMVSGPAARSLGLLARERWRAFGEEHMPPLSAHTDPLRQGSGGQRDLWPSDISADLEAVDVAIARTMPGSDTEAPVRECGALFADSIAHARHAIYIESQYFTNETIAAALAARLREPEGPELIVVAPRECHGWLERNTMGAFRDGVCRELIAADEHQRLRLVYPAASRAQNVPTFVHSKVMIVDDILLRIGSANISRRSMGVDSECDLAVDAGRQSRVRAGIRAIRARLLGEHLGRPAEDIAREIERAGSIRAVVDANASADHTLVPIELPASETPLPDTLRAAADPDEPLLPGASDLVGRVHPTFWVTLAPTLLALAGLGALVRDALLHPALSNRLMSIGAAVLVVLVATVLRAALQLRQFAPSITRHRKLTEFG